MTRGPRLLFTSLIALGVPLDAHASGEPGEQAGVVDVAVGPTLLLRSRSNALGHLIKPGARLGVRRRVFDSWEMGASLLALLSSNHHYRVVGGMAHVRRDLWRGRRFGLGAWLGLGVGRNADILNRDLDADGPLVPYGSVGLDALVGLGAAWSGGVEFAWENLATARAGLVVARRWGR